MEWTEVVFHINKTVLILGLAYLVAHIIITLIMASK